VLSGVTMLLAPLGAWVLWPVWAFVAWRTWAALRGRHREIGVVLLFTLPVAVGQYVLAGLAEGIEGVKRQVIGLFATLIRWCWPPWRCFHKTLRRIPYPSARRGVASVRSTLLLLRDEGEAATRFTALCLHRRLSEPVGRSCRPQRGR
jgi:hypothetical protein